MPWLSIIMALITWLSADKSTPKARTRALLAAGLVGGSTYAVSHYTDWGQANLGSLDGVTQSNLVTGTAGGTQYAIPQGTTPVLGTDGKPVTNSDGSFAFTYPAGGSTLPSVTSGLLNGWGGTAAAVTTGAVLASNFDKYLPIIGVGLFAFFVLTSS